MRAIKYENKSVLIKDRKILAWLDFWIDNEDVICDWNQKDFYLSDPTDVALMNWQENIDNFDDASSLGLEILVKANIIYQDDNAKWHHTEKYLTMKAGITIE